MFELLFKYSPATFASGRLVFLVSWPLWVLLVLILAGGGWLFHDVRTRRGSLTPGRSVVIWLLETALVALLLFMLWHPALSVASLRAQQNLVAVLVDTSASMNSSEGPKSRIQQAADVLNSGFLREIQDKFQVRLYRFDSNLQRTESQRIGERANSVSSAGSQSNNSTRLSEALRGVLAETSALPVGAVVVLSDGGDTTGGVGADIITELRERRLPVHTVGFGREILSPDVELFDVAVPQRALSGGRLQASVGLRQHGFAGSSARLTLREGKQILAVRDITLRGDGEFQTEQMLFNAGEAGAKVLQVTVSKTDGTAFQGELNPANNSLTRLLNVTAVKRRILYVEGEPRWEFKFIRRAAALDHNIELVSMLRTSQNKVYRQGLGEPTELERGFPATAEELFAYDGLIVGSVEAQYFSLAQQELIRDFANRRGGGVLFLGGRFSFSDGAWADTPIAELLPVRLPIAANTFHRLYSFVQLGPGSADSTICTLEEDPKRNAERWKKIPQIANYQEVGDVKPAASVLLEVIPPGHKPSPLLVTQRFGAGRSALLASAGTWRWRMTLPQADHTHEIFWEQLLRWTVADTPGQVTALTPRQIITDDQRIPVRVEVRGRDYQPLGGARVEARVIAPDGHMETFAFQPNANEAGVYHADGVATQTGTYVAEIVAHDERLQRGEKPELAAKSEIGRDVLAFRREDGTAEGFHMAQDKELLERLAQQTGGHYYSADAVSRLPREIELSEAGASRRESKDLWDMPFLFLLALALRASEWFLRRRWATV